jgi:hypothetical protein
MHFETACGLLPFKRWSDYPDFGSALDPLQLSCGRDTAPRRPNLRRRPKRQRGPGQTFSEVSRTVKTECMIFNAARLFLDRRIEAILTLKREHPARIFRR